MESKHKMLHLNEIEYNGNNMKELFIGDNSDDIRTPTASHTHIHTHTHTHTHTETPSHKHRHTHTHTHTHKQRRHTIHTISSSSSSSDSPSNEAVWKKIYKNTNEPTTAFDFTNINTSSTNMYVIITTIAEYITSDVI